MRMRVVNILHAASLRRVAGMPSEQQHAVHFSSCFRRWDSWAQAVSGGKMAASLLAGR
jgi:hypothetical protein